MDLSSEPILWVFVLGLLERGVPRAGQFPKSQQKENMKAAALKVHG